MSKSIKKMTVNQAITKLEKTRRIYEKRIGEAGLHEAKLHKQIGELVIERDYFKKLDERLRYYLDKMVFVAKNFRWIALASIVIFLSWKISQVLTALISTR